ncbi:MAG: nucleotidyl transferase AbiEii/AbiGii toxin family protein [Ignavibacteriaceae bacterium]
MKTVKELNLPFYLTGGTTLSRFYFNHRYSDDLDLFVNADENYTSYIEKFLSQLEKHKTSLNISINYERLIKSRDSTQLFISTPDTELKIDFINDVATHFGQFESDQVLGKLDNWRNILSNKLSAVFRFEIKDYVDIWIIAKHKNFNWREILYESKQKEVGVDPVEIFNLYKSFPFENLNIIKWVKSYNKKEIENDFSIIASDIFHGNDNSLSSLK